MTLAKKFTLPSTDSLFAFGQKVDTPKLTVGPQFVQQAPGILREVATGRLHTDLPLPSEPPTKEQVTLRSLDVQRIGRSFRRSIRAAMEAAENTK